MKPERNFITVNGMALGEETKGNTVQSLVRQMDAHTVWRSGGWQGGHFITHEDGREMGFSFYGAGTFEGAQTYLKHMVISPVELFRETQELEENGVPNASSLISIDQDCLSTTPYHSAMSRAREILRGGNKKGTIGVGVGEAIRDSKDPELAIRAGEFADRATCLRKAETIRLHKLALAQILINQHIGPIPPEAYEELAVLENAAISQIYADACKYLSYMVAITDGSHLQNLLNRNGTIVNEVSHGVLHHPRYGFVPHVTNIDPTSADVLTTVKVRGYQGHISRIGAVRSYFTRHGAGPLVTDNPDLKPSLPEKHNDGANEWLGEFRVGNFDTVALNYALSINRDVKMVDGLMLSFMDVLANRTEWQVCDAYEYTGDATDVEKYFHIKNGRITGIKLHTGTDDVEHFRHQLRLTELLKECRPVLTTLRAQQGKTLEQVFIDHVESMVNVPVVGKAYGPKATDRQYLPSFDEIIRSHR